MPRKFGAIQYCVQGVGCSYLLCICFTLLSCTHATVYLCISRNCIHLHWVLNLSLYLAVMQFNSIFNYTLYEWASLYEWAWECGSVAGNLIDVGENQCYFTADVMYIQCICICMRDEITTLNYNPESRGSAVQLGTRLSYS